MKLYSLRKSKKIFIHVYYLYKKQKKRLTDSQEREITLPLKSLEGALIEKDQEKADKWAREVETLPSTKLKKTRFEKIRDLVLSLGFALFVAILVRQMWFEFYEIPTGSMRPTFKEKDRLAVSKTTFGINIPLTTKHLLFDNKLVQRGGTFIFTGANMPIEDVDALYFYLFPGKKQYVKRLMGKPGDSLYFYGGLIYGVDREGNDISSQLQPSCLDQIDHVPFLRFEGRTSVPDQPIKGIFSPIVIRQMNEPVVRLSLAPYQQPKGEMIGVNPAIKEYSQLWGFGNFAMSRLLTREQVQMHTQFSLSSLPEGTLYLELQHHPSLSTPQIVRDEKGRLRPSLGYHNSLIPLSEEHLRTLFSSLYTARFQVKNGKAFRYGLPKHYITGYGAFPSLADVPDGTYEFYHGKAYEIKWEGITTECPPSHPLAQFSIPRIQLLYNVGIEFDTHFMPQYKNQLLYPSRYSYFRHGDLYLMGSPIVKKEDPILMQFVAGEKQKPYGFVDNGPPLQADGTLDIEFVKTYGVKVSERSYLGLGDNHAMSGDSREFGFIPEDNVRGAPDCIFWPPGSRLGAPNQPSYPWFNLPRTIVWILAGIALGTWWFVHRKRNQLPLFK